jgi:hypothetical protein
MKSKIAALLVLAGGSLFAQGPARFYADRHEERQDLREDYRDLRYDNARLDRLRADVANDRFRLNQAIARGDRRQASRIADDLARDQRALDALLADMARDRRDVRQDHRELNHSAWSYR